MNNLYAVNVASTDMQSYWKVDAYKWTTIISAYPVVPNATTIVEFYMENGNRFAFGCGKHSKNSPKTSFPGAAPNSVAFLTQFGYKYQWDDSVDYGPSCVEGDNITMIIDMHENKEFIKFKKNGNDLGIAYSGLGEWGD